MSINKRNPVIAVLLSIITCGIYGLYWLACLANDVNTVSDSDPNDMCGWKVIVFSLVTCGIYYFVWLYKAGEKIDMKAVADGRAADNKKVLYLVLGILGLGIVAEILMQLELNKYATGTTTV